MSGQSPSLLLVSGLLSSVLLSASAKAATIRVPADYPTIQQAVDAASSGDVIVVSKGTYAESVQIQISGIVLRAKKGHKVTLDAGGASTGLQIGPAVSGVTVRGLRVRNAQQIGIWVEITQGCTVQECRVVGSQDMGLFVGASSGCIVRKCRIQQCPGRALRVDVSSSAVLVEDCRIRQCGDGIVVDGHDVTVRGNRVEDTADHGFLVNGSHVLVSDNEIEGVVGGGRGIVVDPDAENVTVLDNVVNTTIADGVEVGGANVDVHVIAGNKIKNAGGYGIRCHAGETLLADNVIKKTQRGIYLSSLAYEVTVNGNKIRKAVDVGLYILSAPHFITHNDVRKSGTSDLADFFFASNVYVDNVFGFVAP